MKIQRVIAQILRLPQVADKAVGTQDTLLVRIQRDSGLEGIGEVDSSPEVAKAVIDAPFSHSLACGLGELLIGEDPLDTERLWDKVCVLEDSVRMAALAEKQIGTATQLSDFVYIRIGMGIGSCIFIDGEPYRGAGGSAGEFGHMTVDENGPLCLCGNNGCLSALASCNAIIQAVASAIGKGVQSRIQQMAGNDLERIHIEMILQAALENDSLAFRVLHDAAVHIGVALADVVNLLNPSVVVFSGPLFQTESQLMLETIQRVLRQRALEKAANEVNLIVSTLGGDAPALGAARFAAAGSIAGMHSSKH